MHYLIDGYNLLHVTDVFTNAVGPKSLPKLHQAFLDFLASSLGPDDSQRTTVVFDARGSSAKLRRTIQHRGITVQYASNIEDADSLIAELVAEHHSPRQLTVVSSDHQVQRAAKRRRAKAVDSGQWYLQLRRKSREAAARRSADEKPFESAAVNDASWWLAQFDSELLRQLDESSISRPRTPKKSTQPPAAQPVTEAELSEPIPEDQSSIPILEGDSNPFPPEYIAEIVREIDESNKGVRQKNNGQKNKGKNMSQE